MCSADAYFILNFLKPLSAGLLSCWMVIKFLLRGGLSYNVQVLTKLYFAAPHDRAPLSDTVRR